MKLLIVTLIVLTCSACIPYVRGGQGLDLYVKHKGTIVDLKSDRNTMGGKVEYDPTTGKFVIDLRESQNSEAQGIQQANENIGKALDKLPNAIDLLPGQTAHAFPSGGYLIRGGSDQ